MKSCVSILLCLVLVACQTAPMSPEAGKILATVANGAIAADTNVDGKVSNRELKDFTNNPLLWISLIGTALGAGASLTSKRQQTEINQLYDATHKPIGSK